MERGYDPDVKRTDLPTPNLNFQEHNGTFMSTYSNFSPDECTSALQKAIRRGWYEDAFQWGLELFRSGPLLTSSVWNRLMIISVEDVGLADIFALIDVHNLYLDKGNIINFMTAIYILCKAKKSRINDNAVYVFHRSDLIPVINIYDIQDLFIDSLKKKDIWKSLYYRQVIQNYNEKVKIDGKGRATNPQALIWDSFFKVCSDKNNKYIKKVHEIVMNTFRWKDSSQLFQTHIINLICYNQLINDIVFELIARVKPMKELMIYVEKHNKREGLKGIPDYALDKHTRRGKSLGRGFKHFFEEGCQLHNESVAYKEISQIYFERVKSNFMKDNKYL